VPFAVAMDPHDADPPLAISVFYQRHSIASNSAGKLAREFTPWCGAITSNVRAKTSRSSS
jgi:hypothetical protein